MSKANSDMVDSGGTMLDGDSLASYIVLNVLGDIPSAVPHVIKDLIMDVLVSQVLKGLPYLH